MKPLFLDQISTTEAVLNSGFIPVVLVVIVAVVVLGIVFGRKKK